MTDLRLAHRLAIAAVANGLRKGGEVSEKTITAITDELRAAALIMDERGDADTGNVLRALASTVDKGELR